MVSAILNIVPWELIAGGAVALAGIVWSLLNGRRQRKRGRQELATELQQEDLSNADRVKKTVDAVRRDGDTVERLRKQGRIRE